MLWCAKLLHCRWKIIILTWIAVTHSLTNQSLSEKQKANSVKLVLSAKEQAILVQVLFISSGYQRTQSSKDVACMFQHISCSFSGYPSRFISRMTKGVATSIPRAKLSSKQHRSKGEGFSHQPWLVQYVRLLSAVRTPASHPTNERLQEPPVPSHLLGAAAPRPSPGFSTRDSDSARSPGPRGTENFWIVHIDAQNVSEK